ncbi:RHOMBOID-like protein 1 isoform X3 [Pyrus communis]|uniref:RHOMBOID-like protein 1 isoform X3 n=1 Tax=Pyrus communis TaxID=23211 RepID=UPI0035BF9BF3
MERGQSAAPSSLEIKVVSPRRSDNVVHQGGQPPETTTPRRSFSDYNPLKRWVSWLVPSIVVANIVVFVVTMFVNDCPKNSDTCIGRFLGGLSFQPFKENPLLGPSSTTLEKMGALDAQRVVHQHQGWRLISCMWLHAGVFHVLANMLSLVFIGIQLEQEFGFVRIGFLYLMSGFGGSLLSALFIQYGISVGASGALFGLLGSMLSELISNWTMYVNKVYSWPGYSFSRGQSKQSLFLVSLFELCPYVKMELQVTKYLLFGNMLYFFSVYINFHLNI